jgi:type II secretory pathway pseudopilin PulG
MRTRNAGYSILEVMAVTLLISIFSRIAINQIKGTMNLMDADLAANTVVAQIESARQLAIDERRNMEVDFMGTNEIKITRQDSGGGTTVMSDVTLPSGYTFAMPAGIGDTPDGYGNGAVVYFGGGTSGLFLGDGTFNNTANVLINGSVFTMGSGSQTARAVTLAASTGRVKEYWLVNGNWSLR